jgi:hypothetical protein
MILKKVCLYHLSLKEGHANVELRSYKYTIYRDNVPGSQDDDYVCIDSFRKIFKWINDTIILNPFNDLHNYSVELMCTVLALLLQCSRALDPRTGPKSSFANFEQHFIIPILKNYVYI